METKPNRIESSGDYHPAYSLPQELLLFSPETFNLVFFISSRARLRKQKPHTGNGVLPFPPTFLNGNPHITIINSKQRIIEFKLQN